MSSARELTQDVGRRTLRLTGVLAALCLLLAPASAQALPQDAPDPAAFEADGNVFAVARGGGLTFIGGDFTQLRARTGPGVRFNPTTGRRIAPVAEVRGGVVLATAPDGAGGYFIGGTFNSVGGETRNNIAHILPNGQVDPVFDPDAFGPVRALAVADGAVYVGGSFLAIGGLARNNIAKLSATSGNAFSAWDPDANRNVNALAVSGGAVYAGGTFTNIGGHDRNQIAKLSATSGNAFSAWDPDAFFADDAGAVITALAVADGAVYAGGSFKKIGGLARHNIAKLSAASGNAFSVWDPAPNATVLALAVADGAVYVGGLFNDGGDPNQVTIGGQSRNRIAKLSATSGNAFSLWNPDADDPVSALALSDGVVYAGGFFTNIGGLDRNRIAKLSATSGNAFSLFDPNASGGTNTAVNALAVSGSTVYAGGDFDTVNPIRRNRIAALDASGAPVAAFNPNASGGTMGSVPSVSTLAYADGAVYAGGNFTNIGGRDRKHIAKLSAASGNAFSAFDPNANNRVRALAVADGAVYAGGQFTNIGGRDRTHIAKLSATSGNAFSLWNPNPNDNGFVNELAVADGAVYAGGDFVAIGGFVRKRIAKLSAASGNAFSQWNPDASAPVTALAVADGAVYVGGQFNNGGDPDVITIGGRSRNHIAKLSAASGNAFSAWNPDANSTIATLAVSGGVVYAGGLFNDGVSTPTIGGRDRNFLAKLSAISGNAFSLFDPDPNLFVSALAASGNAVYAGGFFTEIGGRPRQGYAQFGTAP